MNKPNSLSIKSFLIRKLAVKMIIPERDLEVVINDQFTSALDALSRYFSVELSGFGKFVLTEKRANRAMKKYISQKEVFENMSNNESLSDRKRNAAKEKLKTVEDNIRTLNKIIER